MICINLAIFAVSAFLKEATRLLALWYIGVSTALGACLGSGHFNFRGSAVGQVPSPLTPEIGQWGQATAKQKTGRMVLIKIAKKKFGDKILAIFRSKKGVWGEPGFVVVRPSCPAKPERSESPKKAKSRKKMKRPTTAGASCRPRSTARSYPSHPSHGS